MAKIKNVSGVDLVVPWLGDRLVLAGQVVEVPDGDVYAYTQQESWDPADAAAKKAHDKAAPNHQPDTAGDDTDNESEA